MVDRREFIRMCGIGLGGCIVGLDRTWARMLPVGLQADSSAPQEELWKWSKEALFYHRTGDGLKCEKCPNGCVLGPGEIGRCRNRVRYHDKLYSIAYGNPCAVHVDPIEKKPLFHFLPSSLAFSIATAGCNLRCLNCQNWEISQASPRETENFDLMPEAVVGRCGQSGCASIAYTYSEPTTFFEYALDTAKLARSAGIKNVWKSNGYIEEQPLRMLCKYLDAANIDLKSFDEDVYLRLNGGVLSPVLRSLKVFREEHVWLEITNLVIPQWTDDFDMIRKMCDWLCANGLGDSPLHFSRFTPLYKLTHLPATPVSTLERAREIAMKSGMRYVYIGNVPGHRAEGTFCPQCGKLVVDRRGFVIVGNHILHGKCEFCRAAIPGVWS